MGLSSMKLPVTLLIAALFFSCGTPTLAQTRQSDKPAADALAAPLAEARKLIMNDQAKAAIDKLSVLPNPSDIRVLHLLGVAYYQTGDYARAIGLLTQVWDNLP